MFRFRKEQRVHVSLVELGSNKTIHRKAKKAIRVQHFRKWVKEAQIEPYEPEPFVHIDSALYECQGFQTGVVSEASWLGGAHGSSHTYSWTTDSSGREVGLADVVNIPFDEALQELGEAVNVYCEETGLQGFDQDTWTQDHFECWRPRIKKNIAGKWEQGVDLHFDPWDMPCPADGAHSIFVPLPLKRSDPPVNRQQVGWFGWLSLLVRLALELREWVEFLCEWFDSVLSRFAPVRQKQDSNGVVL